MNDRVVRRLGYSGRSVAAVAAVALIVKLLLAIKTYGTNDVYSYDQFSVWSQYLGVSLYHVDPLFNHPPSMIHLLHALTRVAAATGVPFSFWPSFARHPCRRRQPLAGLELLGDCGAGTVHILGDDSSRRRAAVDSGFRISRQHRFGRDVFRAAVDLPVERDASPWASGAALGLAHCVKVYPLIAVPAILLHLSGWSRKIKFCAAACVVVVAAWSPYIFQDPRIVIANVFDTAALCGMWGLAYILDQLTARAVWLTPLNYAFEHLGAYIALGLVCVASWRMSTSQPRPPLFSQVGLVFFLFLSLSSGFGVQYLAWLAPWVVDLGWAPAALLYATSGVFLFLVYNLWAEGFPWYLADSYNIGTFVGFFDHVQLICWCSLLVVLWVASKRAGFFHLPALTTGWRFAAAAVTAVAIYAIVPPQLPAPEPTGKKYGDAVRSINARSYLDLAGELSDRRRYRDLIEAAEVALQLAPPPSSESSEANALIAADQAALDSNARK